MKNILENIQIVLNSNRSDEDKLSIIMSTDFKDFNLFKIHYWIGTFITDPDCMCILHKLWEIRHKQYSKNDSVDFLQADMYIPTKRFYKALKHLEQLGAIIIERKQHKTVKYRVNIITEKFIEFYYEDKKSKKKYKTENVEILNV